MLTPYAWRSPGRKSGRAAYADDQVGGGEMVIYIANANDHRPVLLYNHLSSLLAFFTLGWVRKTLGLIGITTCVPSFLVTV